MDERIRSRAFTMDVGSCPGKPSSETAVTWCGDLDSSGEGSTLVSIVILILMVPQRS